MRDKDIEYLYTVEIRDPKDKDKWSQRQIVATSMVEVSRVLQRKLEDITYITKVVQY